jgi:nifR3 family TIM-barrel protein
MRTGAGAALLADPDRFREVVRACVRSTAVPVSVKIRLGLGTDSINVVENALAAQEAGASLITLHPRTAAAKYGGRAAWEYIGRIKESVGIPVCGNGDIVTAADAVRMIEETNCDAVMVGRAAVGNPWLLGEITGALRSPPGEYEPGVVSDDERIALAEEHLALAVHFKGERRGVREVKRHLHRYVRGMPGASAVRERIFRMEGADDMKQLLRSLLR